MPGIKWEKISAISAGSSPNVPKVRCQRGSVTQSAMYIYPFRRPVAYHSLRMQSANSSTTLKSPVPFTAAAIPSVPGQVANTPDASFMP